MKFKEWLKENRSTLNSDVYGDLRRLHNNMVGKESKKGVLRIDCSGQRLTDLEGIEEFEDLEVLKCENNLITDLSPIQNLPNLKYLHCYENNIPPLNKLKNIPFHRLTDLAWDNDIPKFKGMELEEIQEVIQSETDKVFRKFNESSDSRTTLTFNEWLNLKEGDFSGEEQYLLIDDIGLTDLIGIERFTNLTHLEFSNNLITDLTPIKDLNLKLLNCSNNKLKDLKGIENITSLKDIDCQHNYLTNLDELENLTKLNTLRCQNNNIVSLKGIENKKLNYLYCRYNNISPREHTRIKFDNLRGLSWDDNIPELKGMSHTMIKFHLQRKVEDTYRKFNESSSVIRSKDKVTFKQWYDKTYGDFDPNEITQILAINVGLTDLIGIEKLTNLEKLDINNNYIEDLSPIKDLTKITELFCSSNYLKNLHGVESLINLKLLYCVNNKLANLDELKDLKNLEDLGCNDNRITSLKGIQGLNIYFLYCQNNMISPREHMRINFNVVRDLEWSNNIPELKGMRPIEIRRHLQSKVDKVYKSFNNESKYIKNYKDFKI